MKLYDEAYPDFLQIPTLMETVTSWDFMGADGGKPAFAYAMSCECGTKAADSIVAQFRSINMMGRAFGLSIPHNMIYIDVAGCGFTTNRLGLHRLRVACRSDLFDASTIVAQSPCRISRMPDELEELCREWRSLSFHVVYHTTMPAVSMAELDAYYKPTYTSGFTR